MSETGDRENKNMVIVVTVVTSTEATVQTFLFSSDLIFMLPPENNKDHCFRN